MPETTQARVDGQKVTLYPTLVITDSGVAIKSVPTQAEAESTLMTTNLVMLLRDISISTSQMVKGLPLQQRVGVDAWPHGGADGLVEDCKVAVVRDEMLAQGGPVRDPDLFGQLSATVGAKVKSQVRQLVVGIASAMPTYVTVRNHLAQWEGEAIEDMRAQLEFMLPRGAVATHGWQHLRHLPRYLTAMEVRLNEMGRDPSRDALREAEVAEAEKYLQAALVRLPKARAKSSEVREIRWLIQELRVSLFAQRLGTAQSVSLTRVKKKVDRLR